MKTTIIKKVLGVDNQNNVYCVESKTNNTFQIIIYEPISKKTLINRNSTDYLKEFIKDSISHDEIKELYGSVNKAVKSIKEECYYNDYFYPTQDLSYFFDYDNELTNISKKEIFGFVPVTFNCVGAWTIIKEELTNFKFILNKELFCDIITTNV